MRLYLVRHGNTFEKGEVCTHVGLRDMELTVEGMEQGRRLGQYFCSKGVRPVKIYCGNLARQRQTAEVIAEELGLGDVVQSSVSALDELDYGPWEGLTTDQITSRWPEQYRDWTEAGIWPQEVIVGCFNAKLSAIEQFVSQLLETHDAEDTVVAVSSNGVLRYFNALLSESWAEISASRRVGELKVSTGAFCEMRLGTNEIEICSWNQKP